MEKDTAIARQLLIIGGSAGSLDILLELLSAIRPPADMAIVVIIHRKSGDDGSVLIEILKDKTGLAAEEAEEKIPLTGNTIYIAPGDYHLLIEKEKTFSLDASEKVNYSRPSIDVSFESAANAFGEKVIAILLSGANNDGTAGLIAVKHCGGITIVQEPSSAALSFMPEFAVRHASPSKVLTVAEMIAWFNTL